jgi:hypothetical protein
MSVNNSSDEGITKRQDASESSLEDDRFVMRAVDGDQAAFKCLMDKYQNHSTITY